MGTYNFFGTRDPSLVDRIFDGSAELLPGNRQVLLSDDKSSDVESRYGIEVVFLSEKDSSGERSPES